MSERSSKRRGFPTQWEFLAQTLRRMDFIRVPVLWAVDNAGELIRAEWEEWEPETEDERVERLARQYNVWESTIQRWDRILGYEQNHLKLKQMAELEGVDYETVRTSRRKMKRAGYRG